jgi:hypothetical protein
MTDGNRVEGKKALCDYFKPLCWNTIKKHLATIKNPEIYYKHSITGRHILFPDEYEKRYGNPQMPPVCV